MANIGTMPIKLKMLTPRRLFADKIIKAMHAEIVKRLHGMAFQTSVRRGTNKILEEALKSQKTYVDMVAHDGLLRAELGVVDSQSAMDKLVRDWLRSTHVKVQTPRIVGHQVLGSVMTIRSIQADYEDVLSKAYASYTTERGEVIPWLDWLLTKGDELFLTGYITWNPATPTIASRTGTNTVMKKSRGKAWGVPSEYAGTSEDNYATRAIAAAADDIKALIIRETTRRF